MEKKEKILYVITKSNWGGAQKYVFDLSTSLPKDRFDAVVALGGNGALFEKLAQSDVRTISISGLGRDINLFSDIASFFRIVSIIRKEKPEVVHLNSSKIGGLGALAARLCGVKRIVFTCHGWAFNEERGLLSLWLIRIVSWLTVVFSHLTITVSHRDTVDGEKMPGSKNKIRLVHNGVKTPEFKPRKEARARIVDIAKTQGVDISDTDFLLGAVGELHKNKGYEYLLEAFSLASAGSGLTSKLVIVGEGEERAAIESLRTKLGLEKSVALAGFLKEAPTYLKAFDALCLSSIKEGLPYVIIESGFASLPTIASNVGGVKEIIDDMRSGILVQTRKPKDLSQAITLVREDKEKAASFGSSLREKVEQEFSLSHMVSETIKAYESLKKASGGI